MCHNSSPAAEGVLHTSVLNPSRFNENLGVSGPSASVIITHNKNLTPNLHFPPSHHTEWSKSSCLSAGRSCAEVWFGQPSSLESVISFTSAGLKPLNARTVWRLEDCGRGLSAPPPWTDGGAGIGHLHQEPHPPCTLTLHQDHRHCFCFCTGIVGGVEMCGDHTIKTFKKKKIQKKIKT